MTTTWLMHSWLVRALGWTLLHFCWQGCLIAGMLWCVLELVGRRSSAVRYGAACCALVLLVAAPLATFGHLVAVWRAQGAMAVAPIEWLVTAGPGAGGAGGRWMEWLAGWLDAAAPWVPAIWLAGVVLFLARLNVGLVVARRMKSIGTEAVALELARRFEELRVRIGVGRRVCLLHSARVQAPTVIGWLRPVVLMPVGCLAGLSTVQVEALLAHELAHIRRHDYLVSVLQSVVEALLFYHPAVWWVSKQMRLERECRCDAMAVEAGGDALAYAKALSFLEERRADLPGVVLGANGGVLTMRIKRLLGYRESSAVSQGAALVLLAAAIVVPASYVATVARAQAGVARPVGVNFVPRETAQVVAGTAAVTGRPVKAVSRPTMLASVHEGNVVARVETQAGPARVSGGVMAGQIVKRVDPVYPPEAKAEGVQGAVVLKAVISKEGTIDNLQVVSGPEKLWGSALEAVKQWEYKPYLLNGEPTEVETTITVNYSLAGGPAANRSGGSGGSEGNGSSNSNSSSGGVGVGVGVGISGLRQVSDGIMAGQIVDRVDPVYPPDAKKNGIHGAVVLKAVISKEGKVVNLQVVSGPKELMASALDAVKQWTYKPYLLNGQPMDVMTTITVTYSFGEGPGGSGVAEVPKKIGNGVSAPIPVSMPDPIYTEQAKKDKVHGKVLIGLVVDRQGDPTHVRVVRGFDAGLDEKAVETVKRYKFKPAMEDGKPVAVAMNVEVNYQVF